YRRIDRARQHAVQRGEVVDQHAVDVAAGLPVVGDRVERRRRGDAGTDADGERLDLVGVEEVGPGRFCAGGDGMPGSGHAVGEEVADVLAAGKLAAAAEGG